MKLIYQDIKGKETIIADSIKTEDEAVAKTIEDMKKKFIFPKDNFKKVKELQPGSRQVFFALSEEGVGYHLEQ